MSKQDAAREKEIDDIQADIQKTLKKMDEDAKRKSGKQQGAQPA
jgi:hypothetical protein